MLNRWQPWFAGSAGFAAALTIRVASLRSGPCGARRGAHGLSRRIHASELWFAVPVWGHDEARLTRGPGRTSDSDGSTGGPSQVCARSPEFARKTGSAGDADDERPGFLHEILAGNSTAKCDFPTNCSIAQVRDREITALSPCRLW